MMPFSTPLLLDTSSSSSSSSSFVNPSFGYQKFAWIIEDGRLTIFPYAELETDNGTAASKAKDKKSLTKIINMAIAQHQIIVDQQAGGMITPLKAPILGILSTFRDIGTQFFHERHGARSTDHRIWTEV